MVKLREIFAKEFRGICVSLVSVSQNRLVQGQFSSVSAKNKKEYRGKKYFSCADI